MFVWCLGIVISFLSMFFFVICLLVKFGYRRIIKMLDVYE